MIVVDTNVISEMMRDNPDPVVLAWTAAAGGLHTTAITLAEVEHGIARRPASRRRDQLAATATDVFAICAARTATLATRNTGDFQSTGIELVNPWQELPR